MVRFRYPDCGNLQVNGITSQETTHYSFSSHHHVSCGCINTYYEHRVDPIKPVHPQPLLCEFSDYVQESLILSVCTDEMPLLLGTTTYSRVTEGQGSSGLFNGRQHSRLREHQCLLWALNAPDSRDCRMVLSVAVPGLLLLGKTASSL